MNYVGDFNKYCSSLNKRHNELVKALSEVDLEQQDILHFLEFDTYDAVTMMKVTKRLKEVRVKRREIKDELSTIQSVLTRIGKAPLAHEPQTIYTYKTAVLSDISSKKHIVTK